MGKNVRTCFSPDYALNGVVHAVHYNFSETLQPARDHLHLPGGEEEEKEEYKTIVIQDEIRVLVILNSPTWNMASDGSTTCGLLTCRSVGTWILNKLAADWAHYETMSGIEPSSTMPRITTKRLEQPSLLTVLLLSSEFFFVSMFFCSFINCRNIR